jgi:predicted TIM-barrel fold metal-dependent hydrolase
MHQWDTVGKTRENNNSLLGDLGCYLAGEYSADFVSAGINIESAVHVEAFPNDQVLETDFLVGLIESGASPIRGIVANANLSMQREGPDSKSQQGDGLQALEDILQGHLKAGKGYVKGIRWVLNHEPSWPQVHRGDYFTDPQFAAGFAMLAKHGLAFDVQANPHQFKGAAAFFAEHPHTTVVINHMGCLKLSAAGEDASGDEAALAVWREGMAAMAALPNVYIKVCL